MDLTKSQNPNSMVLGSTKIELSREGIEIDNSKNDFTFKNLVDLGLARGVKISFTSSKIDVKADNGTVPLKGQTDMKAKVEFSLLERHLPLLGKIMAGIVTAGVEPGKMESVKEEHPAGRFVKDKFYACTKQNYNGYKLDNFVVKQNNKSLLQETDYKQEQGKGGLWGFKFPQSGAFDPAKPVEILYEAQGIGSYTLSKGSGGVVAPISLRLTNMRKSDDGRLIKRYFDFPYGFYDGEDSVTFKSKNDADNVAEVPISFEFSPHPDLALSDETEAKSLYIERQNP